MSSHGAHKGYLLTEAAAQCREEMCDLVKEGTGAGVERVRAAEEEARQALKQNLEQEASKVRAAFQAVLRFFLLFVSFSCTSRLLPFSLSLL